MYSPGLINEGAFNQLAYAGLENAKKELGAETTYVESVQVPDAPKIPPRLRQQGLRRGSGLERRLPRRGLPGGA